MLRKIFVRKRNATLPLLMLGALLSTAWAQTESALYSFCVQKNCADGAGPSAGVVLDQEGNLYGTTQYGGAYNGNGVVFKLTPKGKETVLYSFCSQNNCTDGAVPSGGLIFDQKENLYGTTIAGGAYNGCDLGVGCGVIFKLSPKSKETVLYSFCAQNHCSDGAGPSGVAFDQQGNLYGTTFAGGIYNKSCGSSGCGVVFKLTPNGKETVLHSFCARYNCTDGWGPVGGLLFDQRGNLYGATIAGGIDGHGVVFKVTPKGKETVLYSFCAQNNCTDGYLPLAGLVLDQKGNLYGTTAYGGAYKSGVAFKLTPEGKETVLYSFCAQTYCRDGANPEAGLVFDQKGNLYGTTYDGGAEGQGVESGAVFELTAEGKETVLYNFCTQDNCYDGYRPAAGLIFAQKGDLYGTTELGGAYGQGIVFKLKP
jgi:uncharacterized repeat protein (TIGR03803 family)